MNWQSYWEGRMSWPLDNEWVCPFCGDRFLTWGFVHGQCRCETCHVIYMMRNGADHVTTPICLLKEEYKEPFKRYWQECHKPIDQMPKSYVEETDADSRPG